MVGSMLPADARAAFRTLAQAPAGPVLVELRADRLGCEEVEAIVRRTPRPLIVTVRHTRDGGRFTGSEEERERSLRAALGAGARFVDVEWDRPLAALADDPVLRDRVILSDHGVPCRVTALRERHRALVSRRAAAHKIVADATEVDQVLAVRELLREQRTTQAPLAAFALGEAGSLSRLLAPSWGSWASYGALGEATAPGQYRVDEMLETYDVLSIGDSTRRFGLVGAEVRRSPSPQMHRAAYRELGLDARYFPVQTNDLRSFVRLTAPDDGVGLEAFGVTMPFKEALAVRTRAGDEVASASAAVNTVVAGDGAWSGYNTDGPAVLQAIRERLEPRDLSVAILGAGGTARAAAYCLAGAGAAVTLFNRTASRAERAAGELGIGWAAEETLPSFAWDILVHATPRGRHGERFFAPRALTGRLVLDAVYSPAGTSLAQDARDRGLDVIDGLQMLAAQAVLQCRRMTGKTPGFDTLHAAARSWCELREA